MIKAITVLGLILTATSVLAQKDPQEITTHFFSLYEKTSSDEAIDFLFSTNEWLVESHDQIENIKNKLYNTTKVLGKFTGYNLIAKRTVSQHLILCTYLVRHDRQPVRFTFVFYAPEEDEWKILNFRFDDNFIDELQEASKAHRLKENME